MSPQGRVQAGPRRGPGDLNAAIRTPDGDATVLVLGWGSTYGPIGAAVRGLRQRGLPIAQAHLRHLNPFPRNLEAVLRRYDRVIVPEMNLGQLALLLRGRFLVDVMPYNQVRGLPFTASELEAVFAGAVDSVNGSSQGEAR